MQNPEKRRNTNHARFSYVEAIWSARRPIKRKLPINIFISNFEREIRVNALDKLLQNRLSFKDVSR